MEIKVVIDVTPEFKEILETIAESNRNLKEVVSDLTKNTETKLQADESLENGLDKKEVKKGKAKKEDDATFDLDADSDVLDLTKDDPEMNEDEEPAPTKTKVSQKAPTSVAKKAEAKSKFTQKDVIKAFQAFAAKKGKEPAIKILKQYKVKKVVDIEPSDFDGVMKLLSK